MMGNYHVRFGGRERRVLTEARPSRPNAELTQLNVCATLGITECDFTNGAAYLAHWLEILRADKREIFRVAADAQRAADFLLSFHPAYAAYVQELRDNNGCDQDTRLKAAA